ncbi:MAG: hypothetical protein NC324_02560 [Bacteroides sp.]|nr:hypothetical protein [Bacteroides sp.]
MEANNEIMVVFHKGRGGRFYNPGHLTFRGEMTISEMESLAGDDIFPQEDGTILDGAGNKVGEVGGRVLDFDGAYDTLYATGYEDLTDEEIAAVKRADERISERLQAACGWATSL